MWVNLLVFAALVLVIVEIINGRPKVSLTHVAILLIAVALLIPVLLSMRG